MPTAKAAPKPKKSPLDRELEQIAKLTVPTLTMAAVDEAGALGRLARGWQTAEATFERGLTSATPEGRDLWLRAKAFVDAGMPPGARDPNEQAAFFLAAGTPLTSKPNWPDFLNRWLAGGLAHALEIALQVAALRVVVQPDKSTRLERITDPAASSQIHGFWLLNALRPELDALAAPARTTLRAAIAPLLRTTTAPGLAWLAIVFEDDALAQEAVARADAVGLTYRDPPWPIQLLEVVRDGETFAHLLSRGGASFQFYGAGCVLRARGRVSDAALADALVRFFSAAMAEPRRMRASSVKAFAAVACAIDHPHLAWLFEEHGAHEWLKKYAPVYAARHPKVRPKRPSARALSARMVPLETRPRPAGFTKPELDALAPAAREERILSLLPSGHSGASLALKLLVDYPTPRAAVAIFEKITHPDFATQMPKPGFHKELQADLRALAKKHPELAAAISAARKSKPAKPKPAKSNPAKAKAKATMKRKPKSA